MRLSPESRNLAGVTLFIVNAVLFLLPDVSYWSCRDPLPKYTWLKNSQSFRSWATLSKALICPCFGSRGRAALLCSPLRGRTRQVSPKQQLPHGPRSQGQRGVRPVTGAGFSCVSALWRCAARSCSLPGKPGRRGLAEEVVGDGAEGRDSSGACVSGLCCPDLRPPGCLRALLSHVQKGGGGSSLVHAVLRTAQRFMGGD